VGLLSEQFVVQSHPACDAIIPLHLRADRSDPVRVMLGVVVHAISDHLTPYERIGDSFSSLIGIRDLPHPLQEDLLDGALEAFQSGLFQIDDQGFQPPLELLGHCVDRRLRVLPVGLLVCLGLDRLAHID